MVATLNLRTNSRLVLYVYNSEKTQIVETRYLPSSMIKSFISNKCRLTSNIRDWSRRSDIEKLQRHLFLLTKGKPFKYDLIV